MFHSIGFLLEPHEGEHGMLAVPQPGILCWRRFEVRQERMGGAVGRSCQDFSCADHLLLEELISDVSAHLEDAAAS